MRFSSFNSLNGDAKSPPLTHFCLYSDYFSQLSFSNSVEFVWEFWLCHCIPPRPGPAMSQNSAEKKKAESGQNDQTESCQRVAMWDHLSHDAMGLWQATPHVLGDNLDPWRLTNVKGLVLIDWVLFKRMWPHQLLSQPWIFRSSSINIEKLK